MKTEVKMNVLMSTYNGEQFIENQIKSIMEQKNCNVILSIRDDGSTDTTVDIIRCLQKKYPNCIHLFVGKNIGYRRSFLKLLELAEVADYYGFADQDDLWKEDKCIRGIQKLQNIEIGLYVSSIELVDERNEKLGFRDLTTSPNNIKSYFIRHRLPGCGMIFTNKLKDLAIEFCKNDIENRYIDHDLIIGSLAYAFGIVIRDNKAYFYHIRHQNSVTVGGRGIIERIKMEKFILFERKNVHYDLAKK